MSGSYLKPVGQKTGSTNRDTLNNSRHKSFKTEKILDLSPVQLTVSNSSQTSVDSVSLFVSDLSQAVSMLDSVIGVRSGVGTVHVS